jgi:antitoxin HicB
MTPDCASLHPGYGCSIVEDEMMLLHGCMNKDAEAGHRSRPQAQEGVGVMAHNAKKGRIARDETFDEFLAGQALLADSEELALKEIIADQIKEAMKEGGITKPEMAARMRTDRRQLDRLLDPKNPSVTLSTLRRAASAVGRTLRVELV